MIGKIIYNNESTKNTKYIKYDVLKCEVENVGYYKDNDKYISFDIPSGMKIYDNVKKSDMVTSINNNKEKISNARQQGNYKQCVENFDSLPCINSIQDIEEEIKTMQEAKEFEKKLYEDIKIIISEKNFKAKAKHLKEDMYLYHRLDDEHYIYYRLAINYNNKLYDINVNSFSENRENYNFDNAIQETLKVIEQQNFNCTIDNFIQTTIKQIQDKKWVTNWILEIIKDYDKDNNTNYYNNAMDIKEEIKQQREKERLERQQKQEENEKEQKIQLENTINKDMEKVNKIIEEMKKDNEKKINNEDIIIRSNNKSGFRNTKLLTYLFEKYNINIPLKTKGIVNDLEKFSMNSYRGRNSNVLFKYLNELYEKINNESI